MLESKAFYFLLHRPVSQGLVGSTDKREAREGDDGNEHKAGAARFAYLIRVINSITLQKSDHERLDIQTDVLWAQPAPVAS